MKEENPDFSLTESKFFLIVLWCTEKWNCSRDLYQSCLPFCLFLVDGVLPSLSPSISKASLNEVGYFRSHTRTISALAPESFFLLRFFITSSLKEFHIRHYGVQEGKTTKPGRESVRCGGLTALLGVSFSASHSS